MKTNLLSKLIILPLIALVFTSCNKPNDGNQNKGEIVVEDQTKLNLNLPYSPSETDFNFTAAKNWSTTPTPSWVTITPTSGEAGKMTIAIKVSENGGADATVRNGKFDIACGDSKVTINITQEIAGTSFDGQLIERIYALGKAVDTIDVRRFTYADNDFKQVVHYYHREADDVKGGDYLIESSQIKYDGDKVTIITQIEDFYDGKLVKKEEKAVATLLKENGVTHNTITKYEVEYSDHTAVSTFTYNNGYLQSVTKQHIAKNGAAPSKSITDGEGVISYTWDMGNIVQIGGTATSTRTFKYDPELINLPILNFDIAASFVAFEADILSVLGFQGARCRNLPIEVGAGEGENSINISYTINDQLLVTKMDISGAYNMTQHFEYYKFQ